MDEYTFENLITNPETPGLDDLIGKEVYFDDVPIYCIKWANEDYEVGILKGVHKDNPAPFFVKTSSGCVLNYPCIIPKKEEPKPKYVPFESKEEFIEAFHYHDNDKYSETDDILLNYGMWLKSIEYDYGLVTRITDNAIKVGNSSLNWKYLLDHYMFLDDSPCGRLVEEKHE